MERVNVDSNKKYSIFKNIFNRDFVVSAVIPIIIFSVFDKIGMTFNGIILSGIWSVGIVGINYIKERKINGLQQWEQFLLELEL